jgi:hypothetical protein
MTRTDRPHGFLARVTPRPTLLKNGVLSYGFVSIPLFGALYGLAAPNKSWPVVLVFHLLTLALASHWYLRYRSAFVGVSADTVQERGFFGSVQSVPAADVRYAVLAHTYRSSSSSDPVAQLLLVGEDDKRLLRMRGAFWSEADMRTIANALDVDLRDRAEPITLATFYDDYPDSAYWFENRPVLGGVAIAATVIVVLGFVLGLMRIIGIPIEGS